MSENGAKRPWLAALLAVLYPGLGHVYLGLWGRAFVWSATGALTATLFASDAVAVAREQGLAALGGELTGTAVFMLVSVAAMAALDAYWHATRGAASGRGGDGPTCPECGKTVDGDLSFCQWCTADLDAAGG